MKKKNTIFLLQIKYLKCIYCTCPSFLISRPPFVLNQKPGNQVTQTNTHFRHITIFFLPYLRHFFSLILPSALSSELSHMSYVLCHSFLFVHEAKASAFAYNTYRLRYIGEATVHILYIICEIFPQLVPIALADKWITICPYVHSKN